MYFQVVGNLTKDPECRNPNSTLPNALICVADRQTNKKGHEYVTSFFFINVLGNTAEHVLTKYKKGDLVLVSGRCRIEKYTDGDEEKTKTKFLCDSIYTIMRAKNGTSA